VGLNLQLTVVIPATIAMLLLAYGLNWMNGRDDAVARGLGLLAAALAGGPIIWQAIKGLSRGRTNVNELVSLSIIGAIALNMPIEAGLVALILQIGALIESVATESARNAVLALQKLAPKHARVKHVDHDHVIAVEKLKTGDTLVVQPGERIAADGKLLAGTTSVDESSVTGESMPVDKTPGSTMLAGTINLTGSAEVLVERVGEHSALGHTIALVRQAQQFQPQIIRAADKFFAFYTPIILVLSAVVLLVTHDPKRMVAMWVIGCPCAMLLASPLAIVVALARASRSGIQVKAGPFVEASASLETVVFDKTGTLTTGNFVVSAVQPADGVDVNDLLRLAATVEQRSSHPIARAIVKHAATRGILPSAAADMTVLEGLGIEAKINGQLARAGSAKIIPADLAGAATRLDRDEGQLPVVPVYLMLGNQLLGAVFLTDEIRPEAVRTIKRLRNLGIKRISMLTGDRRRTAELVARKVGCDDVYAELLPGEKVNIVRSLQRGGRGVAMVGDGINDAPSLAAATVGIAMGVRGTDVAVEAADAVLLKDDLTRVPLLIYLAQQTRSAIYQNLTLSVIFAGLAEAMVAFGAFDYFFGTYAVVMAAVAHIAGVIVIAMNSVRLAGSVAPRQHGPAPAAVEAQVDVPQPIQIEMPLGKAAGLSVA
jgi:Cd2+/Zn2+-exporting ATPase